MNAPIVHKPRTHSAAGIAPVAEPAVLGTIGNGLVRPECVLATRGGDIYCADWRGGVAHVRPDGTQALVVEMGMRGFGHIAQLCEIARPDIGVVTVVGHAHTELVGGARDFLNR